MIEQRRQTPRELINPILSGNETIRPQELSEAFERIESENARRPALKLRKIARLFVENRFVRYEEITRLFINTQNPAVNASTAIGLINNKLDKQGYNLAIGSLRIKKDTGRITIYFPIRRNPIKRLG